MSMPQPRTTFDWAIYADATFAGLAVLIPIPVLDWIVEWFFARRILSAIAKRRGRQLEPGVMRALNNNQGCKGWFIGCFTLPVMLTIELIKSISRKILYFLTIKAASDQLSYYWHRAFLIDYMLLAGHLDDADSALLAGQAMEQVIATSTSSPVLKLAGEVMSSTGYVFGVLRNARRSQKEEENEMIQQQPSRITRRWNDFEAYFNTLAADYEEVYQQRREFDPQT